MEDLLLSGFDHWLLSLSESPAIAGVSRGDRSPRFRFSLPLLHHVRTQRRFFEATIGRGTNLAIRRKSTDLLVEVMRREMERISPAKAGVAAGAQAKLTRDVHPGAM
jgi:hypothetical protein